MSKEANLRFHHPLSDRLEGVVQSWGVDKDEFVAICCVAQDAIRGDVCGGFQPTIGELVLSNEGVDDLLQTISCPT